MSKRGESMRRKAALEDAASKGEHVTSAGRLRSGPSLKDRVISSLQKAVDVANPMRPVTDAAARGINSRKKYKKSE